MALKIISGFIRPDASARHTGAATLNFTTHQFGANDPITVFDFRVIGSGIYLTKPCVTIALRRIRAYVGEVSEPNTVDWNLDDDLLPAGSDTPGRLKISWAARHGFGGQNAVGFIIGDEIREISFLVIGEAFQRPPRLSGKDLLRNRRKGSSKRAQRR